MSPTKGSYNLSLVSVLWESVCAYRHIDTQLVMCWKSHKCASWTHTPSHLNIHSRCIQGASRSRFYGLRVWVLGCLCMGRTEESPLLRPRTLAMIPVKQQKRVIYIESVNHTQWSLCDRMFICRCLNWNSWLLVVYGDSWKFYYNKVCCVYAWSYVNWKTCDSIWENGARKHVTGEVGVMWFLYCVVFEDICKDKLLPAI